MKKRVKCENVGPCTRANKVFEIDDENQQMVCPECGEPLVEVKDEPVKDDGDDNQKKKGKAAIAIIAVLVLLCGGGLGFWQWWTHRITPDDYKLSVTPEEVTLKVGDRILLKGAVEPADAEVTYKWKSTNEKIATITSGGELTALGAGKTSITLRIEGAEKPRATCRVTIEKDSTEGPEPIYVEKITATPKGLAMTVGETRDLFYTVEPDVHDETILTEIADPSIVSYEEGKVKALKAGKTTITFTANMSGLQEIVEVFVNKKSEPRTEPGTGRGTGTGKGKDTTGGGSGRTRGTLDLGYARFSGDILNGKPDGAGVLTYKSRHEAGRNVNSSETVYAEAGESVDGTWNNGYLSSGTLKKKDGNVIKIKY